MAFEVEQGQELETLAKAMDLPVDLAEDAVARYQAVADWLAQDGSPLANDAPDIYPQGSFRLGTPIRALRRNDEFDIDLVCRLEVLKEQTTQEQLKNKVGDRLRTGSHLYESLEPCRRCWTLSYEEPFHLDVLPAIPDLEAGGASQILLTDRDLRHWQHSNPIGYADWFFERTRAVLTEERQKAALAANASIEDVPEWQVRTPLQRVVQLLKRHRDLHFHGGDERRPVSIIITTLAAQAYRQEADLQAAFVGAAVTLDRYIERRGDKWWVANPAHPDENFADKWNESPERKRAFDTWLQTLRNQITEAATKTRPEEARAAIAKGLQPTGQIQRQPRRWIRKAIPPLADQAHRQQPPWPVALSYRCSLRGIVYPGVDKGHPLGPLGPGGAPKGLGLKFQISTNVPHPYDVFWQVVNTGDDARAQGGLRGEVRPGNRGSGVQWESTKYAGTHSIEAFVVKDGRCLARSGPLLVRVWP